MADTIVRVTLWVQNEWVKAWFPGPAGLSSSQAVWGSGLTEECTPALSHRALSLAKSGSNLGPIDMEYLQRVLFADLGN